MFDRYLLFRYLSFSFSSRPELRNFSCKQHPSTFSVSLLKTILYYTKWWPYHNNQLPDMDTQFQCQGSPCRICGKCDSIFFARILFPLPTIIPPLFHINLSKAGRISCSTKGLEVSPHHLNFGKAGKCMHSINSCGAFVPLLHLVLQFMTADC
jgi:hypothetical protein